MKNVLFYYDNYCGASSKGGTEVATYRIAKALKDTGKINVYNAFKNGDSEIDSPVYIKTLNLSKLHDKFVTALSSFIEDNNIDYVVNMGKFFRHKSIVEAVAKSGKNARIIFMQHFAPGSELKKGTYKAGMHLLKLNPFNPVYWLRASVYPLLKLNRNRKLAKTYLEVYEQSNKIILLSDGYKNDYKNFACLKDVSKFQVIPNIFEFKDSGGFEKKKRVLILSRMDEIQKRLSLALQVWAIIEKEPHLKDWQLDIVGTGHNTDIVKRQIKKLKLKNVFMHGWKNPVPFLQQSSILMSTSEYEGLPLSFLEAQAFGCVPIAFDSYASLRDVIANGENGLIIDNFGDIENYALQLSSLMKNKNERLKLSQNAVKSSSKFNSKEIADKWIQILT